MPEKVKRTVILSLVGIFTIFALTSLCPTAVNAHAPQKVLLSYDGATKTLSVTVTHTRFSEGHYVNKVEIRKNGTVVAVQDYKASRRKPLPIPTRLMRSTAIPWKSRLHAAGSVPHPKKLPSGRVQAKHPHNNLAKSLTHRHPGESRGPEHLENTGFRLPPE